MRLPKVGDKVIILPARSNTPRHFVGRRGFVTELSPGMNSLTIEQRQVCLMRHACIHVASSGMSNIFFLDEIDFVEPFESSDYEYV